MAMKIKQFHALPKFGPEKCPVYLRLPWLGSVSTRFEKQVKSAVKQCFSAVEPRVVLHFCKTFLQLLHQFLRFGLYLEGLRRRYYQIWLLKWSLELDIRFDILSRC